MSHMMLSRKIWLREIIRAIDFHSISKNLHCDRCSKPDLFSHQVAEATSSDFKTDLVDCTAADQCIFPSYETFHS